MPGPVRALLGAATGLAQARLGLLGTELREELLRAVWLLAGAGAAIGLALLALAAAAAGLILAASEAQRPLAAALLALGFAAGAAYVAWSIRKALAARPQAFAASLAELASDRAALAERSVAARSTLGEAGGELMRLVSIGMLAYSLARRFTSRR